MLHSRNLKKNQVRFSKPLGEILDKDGVTGRFVHIMERIAAAGAGFRSLTENIDTTTPSGRMMMQLVGAFAEFERAMIRERTSAGLAAARAEGRIGGRRKKLDAAKRREIAESVITGRKSGANMARLYNVSQPTVSCIVAEHRTSVPYRPDAAA
jgi:DNA invertase Pin-like site-specific DNA recombinase